MFPPAPSVGLGAAAILLHPTVGRTPQVTCFPDSLINLDIGLALLRNLADRHYWIAFAGQRADREATSNCLNTPFAHLLRFLVSFQTCSLRYAFTPSLCE